MNTFSVSGQYVDIRNRNIYPARVMIQNQRIVSVQKMDRAPSRFLLPGFIDAHVHIESSMLVPAEFARLAVNLYQREQGFGKRKKPDPIGQ